jgi:hypothetical protein
MASLLTVLSLVLHPYYKLEYIKMAWGGAAEQAEECAAGNPHAKNWQDEALKVVEQTMERYWNNRVGAVTAGTPTDSDNSSDSDNYVGNEFDQHRKKLASQALAITDSRWEAELRRYLKDIPPDVSRDTDIVDWWGVSIYIFLS